MNNPIKLLISGADMGGLIASCALRHDFHESSRQEDRFPDFITFLRHHIAQIENQRVMSKLWVVLGGASKKCVPLSHVCTQET